MKQDIMEVIQKYVEIDMDKISVQLDQKGDKLSILELNIMLPDD